MYTKLPARLANGRCVLESFTRSDLYRKGDLTHCVVTASQVSTPALDLSAHYLLQTGEKLVRQAAGRSDLLVQVCDAPQTDHKLPGTEGLFTYSRQANC